MDLATGTRLALPAQTNGALYQQMHHAGFSIDDLRLVQNAYDRTLPLYNGLYRGAGRPFVCHLVGTASVVVQGGGRRALVLAALLHSLFEFAIFEDGRTTRAGRHVRAIAEIVGDEVIDLVETYDKTPWGGKVIQNLAAAGPPDDPAMRDIWLLRLANEIDDLSNCSISLAPKGGGDIRKRADGCIAMARMIGQEKLGLTLAHFADEYERQRDWTDVMAKGPPESFRLVPTFQSYVRQRRTRPHHLKAI